MNGCHTENAPFMSIHRLFPFILGLAAAGYPADAVILTVNTPANLGPGSLPQVLLSVNDYDEPVEIHFAIGSGPVSITVPSLPIITKSVTIDGTTHPGYSGTPLITISGGGAVTEGLHIRARECTVRGLVLRDFAGDGVVLEGGGGHTIQGNFIGTDATGTTAHGNAIAGLRILNSGGNLIGGSAPGQGNLISGNLVGLHLEGLLSSGNSLQGNFIGTTADGASPLPNALAGIILSVGSGGNRLGGTLAGEGNRIAFNNGDGVQLAGPDTTGNWIGHNAIFSNGGLGINLQGGTEDAFGVTANDVGTDADTGPNHLQNFPEITALVAVGGSTVVRGTLNSNPGRSYRIDLFRSRTRNSSGHGEGETYLDSAAVTTDPGGAATFSATIPGLFPYAWFSATATDLATDDTSEFGAAIQANPGTLGFSALTYAANEDEPSGVGTLKVKRTGGSYGAVTVDFATSTRFGTSGWASEGVSCGPGSDYTRTSGTVSFADGDVAEQTLSIPICNDPLVEGDEVFNVTLSNATGEAGLDELTKEASVFIIDDEVTMSISDTSVSDATWPYSSTAVFEVTLSRALTRDVSVRYATRRGTATEGTMVEGADYAGTSGTLTILRGSTTGKIEVTVFGDKNPEGTETFFVDLSEPVNARLGKSTGTCRISDVRFVGVCCYRQNQIRFAFESGLGSIYRVEFSPTLDPNASWLPVPGAEFLQGNGQTLEVVDPDTSNRPQSFYRVVWLLQPNQPPNQPAFR